MGQKGSSQSTESIMSCEQMKDSGANDGNETVAKRTKSNEEIVDEASESALSFDPLGPQLEQIIESIDIEPKCIAKVISSFIGYIESTLDLKPMSNCITSGPYAKTHPKEYGNEISLIIAPPKKSICQYVLKSVKIRLGWFPPKDDTWSKDGEFQIKVELIDQQNSEKLKTSGNVVFEKSGVKGGGCDNKLITCEMNLELKCGESYLFYLEQTEQQIAEGEVHAWLAVPEDEDKIDYNRSLVKQAYARVQHNNGDYYVITQTHQSLTELTEFVFFHK